MVLLILVERQTQEFRGKEAVGNRNELTLANLFPGDFFERYPKINLITAWKRIENEDHPFNKKLQKFEVLVVEGQPLESGILRRALWDEPTELPEGRGNERIGHALPPPNEPPDQVRHKPAAERIDRFEIGQQPIWPSVAVGNPKESCGNPQNWERRISLDGRLRRRSTSSRRLSTFIVWKILAQKRLFPN